MMSAPIYLDFNATTPVDPEVLEAMLPWLREQHGNPSSTHEYGRRAADAVATARAQVAHLIGAQPREIVFTGCATEANNLALLGGARAMPAHRRHLIVSAIEHPAVMGPAMALRDQGWDVTVLPVDTFGRVRVEDVASALRPDTALVSIMHANNEVGTLQPVSETAELTRARGIVLHSDAAQSAAKIAVHVDDLGVDLLTLAGHKFHAPKGVGALYVRRGTQLRPILYGPDQEHGLRPGTENVAAIVAIGAAAAIVASRLPKISAHLRAMRDRLHARLAAGVSGLQINGHPEQRLPNTLHVSFPGVSGRDLLAEAADSVAASVGSACHSASDAVSGVLAAMGFDTVRATGAVRLSVGRTTTAEEVDRAAATLVSAWGRLYAN